VTIQSLTPHIVVRGADRAAAFYAEAFGAREEERLPVPDGRLMSVRLVWDGGLAVHLCDEFTELGVLSPESVGGTATVLHLQTDDLDALWARATAAGAEVLDPVSDTFWGDRHGRLTDPFGHRWGLAEHVRDVPHDEVVAAAAAMMSG
jgi:PhnB protein